MGPKMIKNAIASEKLSIKEVIRLIDQSGLRVAYIIDKDKKLLGVVSDSEIRKAILKGNDVKEPVSRILNMDPVVLREEDLSNKDLVIRTIKKMKEKMADSRHILILDNNNRPLRMENLSDLVMNNGKKKKDHSNFGKRVLVVGGAGYLGSVLVRQLLVKGFKVRVLDLLMYGVGPIKELLENKRFELIEGDMRNISNLVSALNGVDAVINLAAIVGDPACNNKPEDAIETNFLANKALAEACKYNQVNRFIYASTCSVYGSMEKEQALDENSPLNPVSLYARSKIQAEEGILVLEDENFSPTILRMSTLYGHSPRMRFDLVVNTMTKTAVVDKKICVHGGGSQWRPLLNVEDAARAYIRVLEAPLSKVKGQIFNVGSSELNHRIIDIAKLVNRCIPEAEMAFVGETSDARNYLVSFSKIEGILEYKAKMGLIESIRKIKKAIENGENSDVNNPKYYNVEFK